jgi:hypothetical protein
MAMGDLNFINVLLDEIALEGLDGNPTYFCYKD